MILRIMKDRLKQFMDYKSITAGELADVLEVQRSNISHILNGRNKPGASFIEKLLVIYNDLNARWLLTGEGDMTIGLKSGEISKEEEKDKKKIEDSHIKDVPVVNESISKPIKKVILLFNDGTFSDFSN